MKNKFLLLLCLIGVLCSCSTPKRYLANDVIRADRKDGLVFIGYSFRGAPRNNPALEEDWSLAQMKAESVCREWGRDTAQLLQEASGSSGEHNYYGNLISGAVYKVFHCN